MATVRGTNGQEKALQNLNAFYAWIATQSDDDFKQIIFRGQLNRLEIAKAVGCGKSALNQNPALKSALIGLEDSLRTKGILPDLSEAAKADAGNPTSYDNSDRRKKLDSKRLSSLEVENIELKAKVVDLENKLKRFGELSESLSEMGFIPR